MKIKSYIWVIAAIIIIFLSIFFRNLIMHSRLENSYKKMNDSSKLPFGFSMLPTDSGMQPGYYIWILGPFEYRNRNTGTWGWQE